MLQHKTEVAEVNTTPSDVRSKSKKIILGIIAFIGLVFVSIVVVATITLESKKLKTMIYERDGLVGGPSISNSGPDASLDLVKKVRELEEILLSLGPHLARLNESMVNLSFPDPSSHALFETNLEYNDLMSDSPASTVRNMDSVSARKLKWKIDTQLLSGELQSVSLWNAFLKDVDYFEHAKFYIVRSRFPPDSKDHTLWEADMGFKGLARKRDGSYAWVKSKIVSQWKKNPNASSVSRDDVPWLISKFQAKEFTTWETPHFMFAEVLDSVVPDEATVKNLRQSVQENYAKRYFLENTAFKKPHSAFRHISESRHPSVSIVDIDRDGFDDIYVMPQWGKNSFLRNQGDGTFRDIASEIGLDVKDHSSAACFADFDNDGDIDLFLGRTLEKSMYMENVDGHFLDKTEFALTQPLPGLVSSITAADFNRDGLLDVFFSTYQAYMKPEHAERFLQPADVDYYKKKYHSKERDRTLDRIGPPNRLLVNRGGGVFQIARESHNLELWRNSFQSTWVDYDLDGDPDLYIANDFAPNNLFRNDNGIFTDITEETGTSDIGFGMGASWGDYNNDGLPDLYVSNMFSKAGRRITEQFPEIDPRIPLMARGNSLFRNRGPGKKFEKVSGLKEPKLMVEAAGWSWSGQFVDLDNDGFLDTYALSGMFTLPNVVSKTYGVEGADL